MARIHRRTVQKKDLHDPDNHNGVITHLGPDILEWEVRWVLGSITTNKGSEGDGIPVDLFQILKDNAVKVLHTICQQIWKTQLWPQDRKSQLSFQSQRKEIAQTTTKLHSSHNVGGHRFDPWVGKTISRGKWQPTPILLTGKPHGQRSVVVHGVAKSWTWLSDFTYSLTC